MERKETMLKTGFSRILWAVMAVLLCAPAYGINEPLLINLGETLNVGTGKQMVEILSSEWWWVDVYGTLNIYPGANIEPAVTACPDSTINITGGSVDLPISVYANASVTVFGTDFAVTNGTIDPSGSYFTIDDIYSEAVLTGTYEGGGSILLKFYSDLGVAIFLGTAENVPPVANAGPDVTVSTLDIASTIIEGTASDADVSDSLQYRWLEGTVEFTLWASVGVNGEAYLDLGTILPQYLSVGTHILTLEVKDFEETVSDEMVLDILPTHVDIDIKPGSYPNAINLGSNGVIPVAILSTPDFLATGVDPDTVFLAGSGVAVRGKGKLLAHEEDVNGDGLLDLVVQVETENLDPDSFQEGSAILTGTASTENGDVQFEGSDYITIVPPE